MQIDSKTCITFPVEETSVVIDRKKAHAKVYDYYDNSKSFSPVSTILQSFTLIARMDSFRIRSNSTSMFMVIF